jgi:hypothetical protein
MGFIPQGARWYLAGVVEEIVIEGDPRNVVHINTHLIEAGSPDEAFRKANELGRAGEHEYTNMDGKQVCVSFRGLRSLEVIHDELKDGAELFYEEEVSVLEDELRRWVRAKEELGVFAPVRDRLVGPNYMPGDIAASLEVRGVRLRDRTTER